MVGVFFSHCFPCLTHQGHCIQKHVGFDKPPTTPIVSKNRAKYLAGYSAKYLAEYLAKYLAKYLAIFFAKYLANYLAKYLAKYLTKKIGQIFARFNSKRFSESRTTNREPKTKKIGNSMANRNSRFNFEPPELRATIKGADRGFRQGKPTRLRQPLVSDKAELVSDKVFLDTIV